MPGASGGWKRLTQLAGGPVAGLAAAGVDGGTLVFAATPAGVHRSMNGGREWLPPGSEGSAPFAEAVVPSGSFEHDRTVFVAAGDGLYRSVDGGLRWQTVLRGGRLLCLATAAGEGSGDVWIAGTESDGILRSADTGRTWRSANAGLADLAVLSLALAPPLADQRLGFAGTASGLYRTRNGAQSWRAVDTGLDGPAVQCLAISPDVADDGLILAGSEAHGLLRSDDAGRHWELASGFGRPGAIALAFSASRGGRRALVAATDDGLLISSDGGRTWAPVGRGLGPVLSVVFVRQPDGGEVLLAGRAKGGIVRSEDDGTGWTEANCGLHSGLPVGLVLSPGFASDRTLFSADLRAGVAMSTDGGETWLERTDGLAGAGLVFGLAISPNFARDQALYAATAGGLLISRNAGARWQPPGAEVAEPALLVATAPASSATATPTILVALTGGRLLASHDGGETWQTLGSGFENAEVISLAVSSGDGQRQSVFVGTRRSVASGVGELTLWRSIDAGAHWSQWLVQGGDCPLVLAMPRRHGKDEVVFAALAGQVLTPMRDTWAFREPVARPSWCRVDLGGGALATALAVSPQYATDGRVFVGSSHGIFASRDGGQHFCVWNEGMSQQPVVAVAPSPAYAVDGLVYAVGLGGSLWRRLDA